ncbi:MAG: peptidoglycan bridge formation glycyltransferase FemA/FemB family protein [Candidatus Uhrbacteria bacterium]
MNLVEITSQKEWDAFVSALPYAQFTQSWAWGELQASLNREVKRYFIVGAHGNEPDAAIQLIHQPRAIVGGYWLAPRGPVGQIDAKLLGFLEKELVLPNGVFVRVEPLTSSAKIPSSYIPHRFYNPSTTALLDLTKSEEELLAAMHSKTRYNIRVAEKHGVTVREGTAEDLEAFIHLSHETSERDQFLHQSESYLRKTFQVMSAQGYARLRLAEYRGKLLAANMEIVYGDTLTYLHGASSSESRNVMAPFILHWDAIRCAKAEGFKTYDFWGCNPASESAVDFRPRWEGISRFKMGWGSERVSFVGTFDLVKKSAIYKVLSLFGRV